jgi:uncharacterized protein YlxW (UPF0749 family)
VTAAQKGGGVRALGASLLDQVLAETLDPAYAQAAEARAARAADGATDGHGGRRGRGRVLVLATLLVTGLLLALAYNQAASGSQGREENREALVRDIQRESAAGEELEVRLEELEAELVATREQELESTLQGQRALERLDRASTGAAALPVTGPGLVVTLGDPEPDADSDPVGGQDTPDPRGKVGDGDLQRVVNALWAAGAEAISVNEHRLGATTAIRTAGEAVLVEFRPVANPYEVRAVGDPGRMSRVFLENPDVRALGLISRTYGMRFDYAVVEDLELPAAPVAELRLARSVADAAAADAGSATASPAPSSAAEGPGAAPGAAP